MNSEMFLNPSEPGRRVLLVEDDPIQQVYISRLLEKAGKDQDMNYKIDVASGLRDARRFVNRLSQSYDMVLCDVQLDGPDDGFHFKNYCSRRFPNMRVVLTSGGNAGPHVEGAYIPKKLAPREYFETLSNELVRGRSIASKKKPEESRNLNWFFALLGSALFGVGLALTVSDPMILQMRSRIPLASKSMDPFQEARNFELTKQKIARQRDAYLNRVILENQK